MKRRSSAHVVVIDDSELRRHVLFCRHCGAEYVILLPALVKTYAAAAKSFDRLHRACPLTEYGLLAWHREAWRAEPMRATNGEQGGVGQVTQAPPRPEIVSLNND